MTDRVHSLNVVLDRDIRTDDVEPIILAIRMIRGVVDVKGEISDPAAHMAYSRARAELSTKLFEALNS